MKQKQYIMKKIIAIISFLTISFISFSKEYSISSEGIEFIKKYETCSLTAYKDANGYSIGYGHHGSDVYEGMTITRAQADEYFRKDINKFKGSVKRLLEALPYEYEFSQGFIDGIYSLIYNCGEGGVKKSTFYQRLLKCRVKNGIMNENDFNYTVAGVKESRISAPGHIKRRHAEHLMMLS